MLEVGLFAFFTLFATVSPIDASAIFAALTIKSTTAHRRTMAIKGTLIGAAILIVFWLIGDQLLARLGITLAALRTAGGILLLLISIDMVFARPSGGTSTTADETEEAEHKEDISVFPLATPLIAGPGTMGAIILLAAQAGDDWRKQAAVFGALMIVMTLTLLFLLTAGKLQKFLGVTGLNVISRVVGVLLSALAVQFIFDGIASSGIFR